MGSTLYRYGLTLWVLLFLAPLVAFAESVPIYRTNASDQYVYELDVSFATGIKERFILDTGAASVLIPTTLYHRLSKRGLASQPLRGGYATVASGKHIPVQFITIKKIRIGNTTITDVPAMVSSANTLLLGQSALQKLPNWSLDYRFNRLRFDAPGSIPSKKPPAHKFYTHSRKLYVMAPNDFENLLKSKDIQDGASLFIGNIDSILKVQEISTPISASQTLRKLRTQLQSDPRFIFEKKFFSFSHHYGYGYGSSGSFQRTGKSAQNFQLAVLKIHKTTYVFYLLADPQRPQAIEKVLKIIQSARLKGSR